MRNPFYLAYLACAIIVFTVLFLRTVPQVANGIPHLDKIAHFGIFFILTFLAYRALKDYFLIACAAIVAYGGLIEIAQSFVPHRSGSWLDFAADVMGVIVFIGALELFKWQKNQRLALLSDKEQ
ncbi:VanZ family protein [Saccharobesus litoralis]|uniref:VanZ family protein n=1 Tax=Saccharobesus litoralis TaxID=2172099 RepID=UPI00131F1681|nr:VanZ family protein [Saccharobesus litoralis]